MKVYRVGHADHRREVDGVQIPSGPYTGVPWDSLSEDWPEMIWSHSGVGSEEHHPAPYLCPILRGISTSEVCGFDSLGALLNWFAGWHDLVADNDFRVWVYDVPDDRARVGTFGQAVFFPSSAVLVDVFDLPLGDVQLPLF